jgi:hypothetical protein
VAQQSSRSSCIRATRPPLVGIRPGVADDSCFHAAWSRHESLLAISEPSRDFQIACNVSADPRLGAGRNGRKVDGNPRVTRPPECAASRVRFSQSLCPEFGWLGWPKPCESCPAYRDSLGFPASRAVGPKCMRSRFAAASACSHIADGRDVEYAMGMYFHKGTAEDLSRARQNFDGLRGQVDHRGRIIGEVEEPETAPRELEAVD